MQPSCQCQIILKQEYLIGELLKEMHNTGFINSKGQIFYDHSKE